MHYLSWMIINVRNKKCVLILERARNLKFYPTIVSCYMELLGVLGQLVRVPDCTPDLVYLGGLVLMACLAR